MEPENSINRRDDSDITLWKSAQRLLTSKIYQLSKDSIDVDELRQILAELGQCLVPVLNHSDCIKGFFCEEFRPNFGHLVHLLLEIMSSDRYEVTIRVKAAEILSYTTDHNLGSLSSDALSLVLPGVVGRCMKIALNSANVTYFELSVISLKILSDAICCCMNNSEYEIYAESAESIETNTNKLSISKNKAWFKMASEKLLPSLATLSAKLCANNNYRIRYALLNSLSNVYEKCSTAFGNSLAEILIDLCVILLNDPYSLISEKAEKVLKSIEKAEEGLLFRHLSDKLYRLCTKLPTEIRNATSGSLPFQNVINIVRALGPVLLNRIFLASSSYLERLCISVATIIRVNKKKLMISQATSGDSSNSLDVSTSFPLDCDISYQKLLELFQLIIQVEDFAMVFDVLLENINSMDTQNKVSYAILLCAVIENINKLDKIHEEFTRHLKSFIQEALRILSRLDILEPEISDEQIEDQSYEHSHESCLATALLTGISLAMNSLQNDRLFNQIMIDTIYETLKWCAVSNFIVKASAELSLRLLAKANGLSVPEMLLKYGNYIAYKISLVVRDFANNQRAPLVLSEMLNRCDDSVMYEQVRFIVMELIVVLDRNDQQQTTLILRALRNFIRCLRRWFPGLKPPEELPYSNTDVVENPEESNQEESNTGPLSEVPKQSVPSPIQSAIEILRRTKHMISSPYLPIRILVLDILDEALLCVEHFENELLPMIHQNWLGLIRAFDSGWQKAISDDGKLVAARAIRVAETMCRLSGNFVYRKIMDELVPNLIKIMKETVPRRRTPSVYMHTSTFKFQLAVIQCIPTFVEKLELSGENKNAFIDILKTYSNEECQEAALRKESDESIRRIESLQLSFGD
uniref:Uncharacterized protein n=1 Tax=Acrobeloides nanus TaxID=290746 RepID=A0A914ENW1_9BILA